MIIIRAGRKIKQKVGALRLNSSKSLNSPNTSPNLSGAKSPGWSQFQLGCSDAAVVAAAAAYDDDYFSQHFIPFFRPANIDKVSISSYNPNSTSNSNFSVIT